MEEANLVRTVNPVENCTYKWKSGKVEKSNGLQIMSLEFIAMSGILLTKEEKSPPAGMKKRLDTIKRLPQPK